MVKHGPAQLGPVQQRLQDELRFGVGGVGVEPGAVNTSQALVYSQIVLSFGIPFALIPLLIITRDRRTMTDMVNRRLTSILMLLTTIIITGLNLCLLYDASRGLL